MTAGYPGLGGDLLLPAARYARQRALWLAARRQGLGASETAGVLQVSPFDTPLRVWTRKMRTGPVTEDDAGEAAEWGHRLEAPVARAVGTRHRELGKIAPTPGLLAHERYPFVLATIDRLIVERGTGRLLSILEVKTCSERRYREDWADGWPPVHILVQCQQQLAVTGLDHLYVAVLVGGQKMPEPVRIDRDDAVIATMLDYVGQWWADHVEGKVRPAPILADAADLSTLWPGDGKAPPLTARGDLLDTVARLFDAKRRAAEADAEAEALTFAVKAALGDRTALVDASGRTLATWKPAASSRVDITRLRRDHPDLVAAYTEPTTSRRFLPAKDLAS